LKKEKETLELKIIPFELKAFIIVPKEIIHAHKRYEY
jgi:hypothetical protein